MPEDRPHPGRPPERQGFSPRPFRPAPRLDGGGPPAVPHTVRIRDGEREIEVSGSAPFVRQVLDDLAHVWSQLRGDGPAQPASIRMPEPVPIEEADADAELNATPADAPARGRRRGTRSA